MAVQGNMLVGEAVLLAMAAAFRASAGLDLDERMMLALEAGDAAGGDKRGRQSAALKLYHHQPFPLLDVRVDEHPESPNCAACIPLRAPKPCPSCSRCQPTRRHRSINGFNHVLRDRRPEMYGPMRG